MMHFFDSILPHQVERGVCWSKLLSTDPEIDIKEVVLILKWDFREINVFENFLQTRKQTFPSAVTLDVLGGKKKKSQRAGGAFSGWWMLLQGSKFFWNRCTTPHLPNPHKRKRDLNLNTMIIGFLDGCGGKITSPKQFLYSWPIKLTSSALQAIC